MTEMSLAEFALMVTTAILGGGTTAPSPAHASLGLVPGTRFGLGSAHSIIITR